MKISEILHLAADEYLWDGSNQSFKAHYSCNAIYDAVYAVNPKHAASLRKQIKQGLKEMGLKPNSTREFREFNYGKECQAARYNWLKFTALIAEEQGM